MSAGGAGDPAAVAFGTGDQRFVARVRLFAFPRERPGAEEPPVLAIRISWIGNVPETTSTKGFPFRRPTVP